MEPDVNTQFRQRIGRLISIGVVISAIILGVVVLYRTNYYPRTDDAQVFANFIGIAPQVEGPLVQLNAQDNQFVRKGELLFEIDERPYAYALERATSDQAALEGQISDERRKIAALVSAVSVAQANIRSSEADVTRLAAAVDQARADLASAEQGVQRARAEWAYANNNLNRLKPLLAKQFVTVDQVDRAESSATALAEALKQAESQVQLSQAGLRSASAQYEHAKAVLEQSKAQHEEAQTCGHNTRTIDQPAWRKSSGRERRPIQP